MDALDRYLAGWTDHDPVAVVGSLVEGGTYEDPTTAGPLSGDALAENVAGLVVGFPDVPFDFVTVPGRGGAHRPPRRPLHRPRPCRRSPLQGRGLLRYRHHAPTARITNPHLASRRAWSNRLRSSFASDSWAT